MTLRVNGMQWRFYTHRLLVLAFVAVLAACDSPTPKLPQVKTETVSHVIVFEPGKKRPGRDELAALKAFVGMVPVSAVSYAGLVADDRRASQLMRAQYIKHYLVSQGIAANVIHLQPVAERADDSMLLSVEFTVAIPPQPCPDWSSNATANYNNTVASNFGCSYYNNTILQMSDPADYNGRHAGAAVNAARDSVIMQKYLSNAPASAGGTSSAASGSSSSPQ